MLFYKKLNYLSFMQDLFSVQKKIFTCVVYFMSNVSVKRCYLYLEWYNKLAEVDIKKRVTLY